MTMPFPTISVVNFSNLSDNDVQSAIRAVNRQISEDFAPIWGSIWDLRLHGSSVSPDDIDSLIEESIQGEAVLYLTDQPHLAGAAGYHAINGGEKPYGFVFVTDPDDWTVTLSHEALELIIDPTVNVMVPGPDPRPNGENNTVLHAYEVCDAVERTSYLIDEVRVSNFITQQWFFADDAQGTRNDFLGVGVPSFNATPGSHLAFLDLNQGWMTYYGQAVAAIQPGFMARQQRFDHERKRLGHDEEPRMIDVLETVKSKPPKMLKGKKARHTLERIVAVTRSGRRQYAPDQIVAAE
jgi:hypothetical protein